jgi:hypothetical protein
MSTLRKYISDVRSAHKILSSDAMITDRVIASQIKNYSLLLIKRETNLRKLWSTNTIFTTVPCLEMIEVPISECCDYVDECTIARSKYKLPKIAEGNYQYLIQGVYSVNAMGGRGKKLKEISINRYINLLKLPIVKNEHYYWIFNGYLYVTNPDMTAIRMSALFEEDIPSNIMFPDCECSAKPSSIEEACINPLDQKFALPGYLSSQVLELTSQKLMNTYFRLKSDQSSDNIDGQAPNTRPIN